jgi:RNA polymerase sigma-70 factor (ECF subfamily)
LLRAGSARVTATLTVQCVRRALDGDASAREELLGRVRPRLVLWAASRMSPELRAAADPEDIAQEVLLAVHRDFERLAPRESAEFLPWLFGVAENRVRDLVDRVRAAKRNGEPPQQRTVRSVSSLAGLKEDADRLLRAIAQLSDDHREVLQLRRFEDLPAAEVGRRMGRTEGAVRVLYFRAVAALRVAMGTEPA